MIEGQANEGQIRYQNALAKKIEEWITAHPDDFPATTEEEKHSQARVLLNEKDTSETTGSDPVASTKRRQTRRMTVVQLLALSNLATLAILYWSMNRPCIC